MLICCCSSRLLRFLSCCYKFVTGINAGKLMSLRFGFSLFQVRRSAQECLEKVFKSFRSFTVVKEASKLVFSLFKNYMPVALTLSESRIFDESKEETLSKLEHLDVIHMLNLLKVTVPYLSVKISSKVLPELVKLLRSEFSVLTRQVFQNIEAFLVSSSDEVIGPQEENIIDYEAQAE